MKSGILVETNLMLKEGTFITVTIYGLQFTEEMLLQGNVAAVVRDYMSDTLKAIEMLRKKHSELVICALSLRYDVPLERLEKLDVTYGSKARNSPESCSTTSNNFYLNKTILHYRPVKIMISTQHSKMDKGLQGIPLGVDLNAVNHIGHVYGIEDSGGADVHPARPCLPRLWTFFHRALFLAL